MKKILPWASCLVIAFGFLVVGEYGISATWAAAAMLIAVLYKE